MHAQQVHLLYQVHVCNVWFKTKYLLHCLQVRIGKKTKANNTGHVTMMTRNRMTLKLQVGTKRTELSISYKDQVRVRI